MFWNTNGKALLVGRNMDYPQDDQPTFYVFPKGMSKNGVAVSIRRRGLPRWQPRGDRFGYVAIFLLRGSIPPDWLFTSSG